METLEAPIPLKQIFHLIFRILFWKPANKQLARSIVHLRRNDAHCHSVDYRHRSSRFDLGVLIELGRSTNTQDDIVVAYSVKLDGSGSLLNAPKLEEDKLLLRILARVYDWIARVEHTTCLLELFVKELFEICLCHVWLHIAHINAPCVQSRTQVALKGVRQSIAESQRVVLVLHSLLPAKTRSHQILLLRFTSTQHARAHLGIALRLSARGAACREIATTRLMLHLKA